MILLATKRCVSVSLGKRSRRENTGIYRLSLPLRQGDGWLTSSSQMFCGVAVLPQHRKSVTLQRPNGISVITHAGMNYPYGQHLAFAMPAITWGERSEGVSAPGVPLEEMVKLPGTSVIKDGYVAPSDAPGFGLEIDEAWIESVIV